MEGSRRGVRAIILAAGLGSRLGRDKASLPIAGQKALDRILKVCSKVGLEEPCVVSGAHWELHQSESWAFEAHWVFNEAWSLGRTGSLQLALTETAESQAWLLWPVDMPLISASTVESLLDAYIYGEDEVWIPSDGQRRGHPIMFGQGFKELVLKQGKDFAIRELYGREEVELRYVEVKDEAIFWDIDTLEDWRRIEGKLEKTR